MYKLFNTLLACMILNACCSAPPSQHQHTKRDANARRAFMASNPCPATGKTKGACPGYVVDHIVPLKRGGGDHPYNMQWQTVQDGKDKDKWE